MKHNYEAPSLKVFFAFSLLFLLNTFQLHSQFIINENYFEDEISLHPYAKIANLEQNQRTIHEIILDKKLVFSDLPNENTDLGFTKSHYWIKFQIFNTTDKELTYFLETCRPIVDFAEFYTIDSAGKISKQISGDGIAFNERSFKNRKIIFKVVLEPHQKYNYYLHLKSDGEVINAGIILRTMDNLMQTVSFEQVIFGIFYGILLITAIIYLFFFFAMKERSFLYYSLYVVFIGMLQFSIDGYFYQLFTPNSGWLSLNAVILSACIANFFLGRYAQVFLQIRKYSQFINLAFYVVFILDFILFTSLFIHPNALEISYPIANVLGLFLLVLIVSSIIVIYHKTGEIDKFFVVGIFFLIAGFVVFILKNFSILPVTFMTENGSKLGTGMEVIFLSLSMANLIRKLRDEREELQEVALQKSEEMNEMKSYFLSNISHELRTPLNAILNLSKEISKDSKDEIIQRNSRLIKDSSYSLLSSVNDILDFSKIEKGELKLDFEEFSPKPLLEHLAKNMAYRAKNQGLGFNLEISPDLPEMILGDKMRLTQMINNVLSNGLKFTTHGFVSFKVECKQKKADTVDFIFTIADTGVGIPKEKMNSIFESFTQESINNKRKFGGLGLGLYIVKTLADLHNGKVDLQSILDQGTVCKITLEYQTIAVEKQEIQVVAVLNHDLKGKTILVVEDNAMNQMVIKMITKKWLNTTVVFANNGQEGVDALRERHFDLILMDLQMPVMDGYEATIAIRNGVAGDDKKNIPIIALTADVMETTKDRVMEIGMNKYMSKPVDKELLFKNISELV
ncbi:hybrid sensor histidine kinase/response regulator [Flavobacterium lacus]|uniref:histidine kinase n=1 Tax=Flavobacterium lacus TaxID=1353778 RepID=A0A328WQC3_9FLAO|nr:hybrid sensor histidine kinase/response regulator [Flavobacterium lacus]RAR48552.1 signal transduction histidine kinase [Flavobacterium lacus]